jgi:hypothetical protein
MGTENPQKVLKTRTAFQQRNEFGLFIDSHKQCRHDTVHFKEMGSLYVLRYAGHEQYSTF